MILFGVHEISCGFYMDLMWMQDGFCMDFICISYGFLFVCYVDIRYGFYKDFPWILYGSYVDNIKIVYGFFVWVFHLDFHSIFSGIICGYYYGFI